jgi:hypothetical protein
MFAFDRVKALAPQHPEWKTKGHSPPSSKATEMDGPKVQ